MVCMRPDLGYLWRMGDSDLEEFEASINGCELKPRQFYQTLKMQATWPFTGPHARLP